MKDTTTRLHKNRRVRQEALREQLSNQGHLQHVVDILEEIQNADLMENEKLSRLKVVIDTKMRLINKYLPDLKSTEITGDVDNPITLLLEKVSGNTIEPK
tara:strand:+ start:83 stop:382 length:300 start_codon:yes stop_codon:yes gene_type:complete